MLSFSNNIIIVCTYALVLLLLQIELTCVQSYDAVRLCVISTVVKAQTSVRSNCLKNVLSYIVHELLKNHRSAVAHAVSTSVVMVY